MVKKSKNTLFEQNKPTKLFVSILFFLLLQNIYYISIIHNIKI